jgi:hypothetical protein
MSKQMGSSKWFMWNVVVQGDNLISIIFPNIIMVIYTGLSENGS